MVRRSLPYMGLARNNPELNHKIVEFELERYRKFQAEAKEKGMDLEPCLEGYRFIHRNDSSKNYFMSSGMLNASAVAKDLFPIEPMVGGASPIYDRDIDVSAVVITKEKRKFDVIDRAIKKARQEITEEKLEVEARKKRTYNVQEGYMSNSYNRPRRVGEWNWPVPTEAEHQAAIDRATAKLKEKLENDADFAAKWKETMAKVAESKKKFDQEQEEKMNKRYEDPSNPFSSNYNGDPVGPDSFGGSDDESHYMCMSVEKMKEEFRKRLYRDPIEQTVEVVKTSEPDVNFVDWVPLPDPEPITPKTAIDQKATEELRQKIKMREEKVLPPPVYEIGKDKPTECLDPYYKDTRPCDKDGWPLNPDGTRVVASVTWDAKYLELPKSVNHGWIQLYSGRKFYPMDPKVEDIDIQDIAHSLSNMCRFTGHCKSFYSVAQHSVMVSYLVGGHALWGLLHDASEAYLVDMPRPIKRLKEMESFRTIENSIQLVVCKKFGLQPNEPPVVKEADMQMLATEARDLMGPLHPEWKQPCNPLPFKIEPLQPNEAKQLFMARYNELVGAEGMK